MRKFEAKISRRDLYTRRPRSRVFSSSVTAIASWARLAQSGVRILILGSGWADSCGLLIAGDSSTAGTPVP